METPRMHRLKPWRRAAFAAALLAGTALTAVSLPLMAQPGAVNPPAAPAPQAVLPDFSALVAQVKPAVVSITTTIDQARETDGEGQQIPLPFPFNQMIP